MNDISYTDWNAKSDANLAKTIGDFIKHHRMKQNKTQEDVAKAANISRSTLSLLENGEAVRVPTLIQVLRVLDQLQIMDVFIVNEEISPLEYARLQEKKRQRVRNKKPQENEDIGW